MVCPWLVSRRWRGRFLALVRVACCAALPLILPIAQAALPSPGHNVLIIGARDSLQPAYEVLMRGFRSAIGPDDGTVQLFTEFLDASRFPQTEPIFRLLQEKYKSTRIDLIVTINPPALRFALEHRAAFFPGVPMVFAAVSAPELPAALPPDVIGVVSQLDPAKTVELARRLQPEARHAVFVAGADATDQMWEGIVRRDLHPQLAGLEVRYLSGLPQRQLLEEVARLPPDTFVLYLSVFRDGAGNLSRPVDVAQSVSMAATAPTYAFFSNYLGHGVVGGYMSDLEETGRQTAVLASRVLSGARPDELRPGPAPSARYVVDWRQLQRWGLNEARLPPGSELRFREASIWMNYRWQIVATATLVVAQAILIASLLIQRRRRKLAELEVQRQRVELAHVSRLTTLGELSASIAHEVNQPLAAIAGNADAVELLLDADPAQLDDARRVLLDLKAANQRASEVVRRVRDMVRKREAVSETYDLNGAVSDVMRLLEPEAMRRHIDVGAELEVLPTVRGDRLQLQQVMVNLVMNGMEAVADMPEGERRITVRTGRNSDDCAEVAVADTGRGIPTADITRVFDSFFTTKKEGMGLGLWLCRSLVQAHGGRIWAQNNAGSGATFRFTVPYGSLPA